MNPQIEIIETVSKTERVRYGAVTATVNFSGETVTSIDGGMVSGDEGQTLATFGSYGEGSLNVQFYGGDMAATLATINEFINLVKE